MSKEKQNVDEPAKFYTYGGPRNSDAFEKWALTDDHLTQTSSNEGREPRLPPLSSYLLSFLAEVDDLFVNAGLSSYVNQEMRAVLVMLAIILPIVLIAIMCL